MKLPIAVAAQRAESHFRGRKWPAGEIHDTRFPSVMAAFDSHTTLSWTDLIGLCLITSDNDAANLLLSELPDDSIQAVLDEAGCENTSVSSDFSDLSLDGLDRENPTSAADVARILALIHRSEPAISRKMTNNLRNRRIPRLLDPTLRVANKTGSLDRVCNDAALIYADQTDLVFVVMANSVGDMVSAEVSITRIAEALTRDLELGSP